MATKTDRITEVLEGRIRSNAWTPGIRIPATEVLAEEFEVGRGTVRSVLERLHGGGLIYKRGNSWYVVQRTAR